MLRVLLSLWIDGSDIPKITSLFVQTQFQRIDVLVVINEEDSNGLVMLIEDKINAHEHSNQIERYIETVSEEFPNRRLLNRMRYETWMRRLSALNV